MQRRPLSGSLRRLHRASDCRPARSCSSSSLSAARAAAPAAARAAAAGGGGARAAGSVAPARPSASTGWLLPQRRRHPLRRTTSARFGAMWRSGGSSAARWRCQAFPSPGAATLLGRASWWKARALKVGAGWGAWGMCSVRLRPMHCSRRGGRRRAAGPACRQACRAHCRLRIRAPAAVVRLRVIEGDERGDMAIVRCATAAQAASVVAQLFGRKVSATRGWAAETACLAGGARRQEGPGWPA